MEGRGLPLRTPLPTQPSSHADHSSSHSAPGSGSPPMPESFTRKVWLDRTLARWTLAGQELWELGLGRLGATSRGPEIPYIPDPSAPRLPTVWPQRYRHWMEEPACCTERIIHFLPCNTTVQLTSVGYQEPIPLCESFFFF